MDETTASDGMSDGAVRAPADPVAGGLRPPYRVRTPRLVLRRPTMEDAAFHHALHSDPVLYTHSPSARQPDPDANAAVLRGWIEHWEREGFGYWVAELAPPDDTPGRPVGFVGVRRDGEALNLYYRFTSPVARGSGDPADPDRPRGLGREAARAAVAWATQWLPDEPVQAVCKQTNAPANATAQAAGLLPDGAQDAGDGSMFRRWVSPRFDVTSGPTGHDDGDRGDGALDPGADSAPGAVEAGVGGFGDEEVTELLDVWERVVRAGGAVGFRRDADRTAIARTLAGQLEATAAGQQILVRMREPGGRLLGFAWWVRGPRPLFAHVLELSRLMVDPAWHGRQLGALLLARLHAVAREQPGVRLLHAEYRDNAAGGLGRFYAAHGYTEVGRLPGLIQPEDDVFVDAVAMLRRLDGEPLRQAPRDPGPAQDTR